MQCITQLMASAACGLCSSWLVQIMACADHGLCSSWPVQFMACADHGLCRPWPVQLVACADHGLCRSWPVQIMACADHGLCSSWLVQALTQVQGLSTPASKGGQCGVWHTLLTWPPCHLECSTPTGPQGWLLYLLLAVTQMALGFAAIVGPEPGPELKCPRVRR